MGRGIETYVRACVSGDTQAKRDRQIDREGKKVSKHYIEKQAERQSEKVSDRTVDQQEGMEEQKAF